MKYLVTILLLCSSMGACAMYNGIYEKCSERSFIVQTQDPDSLQSQCLLLAQAEGRSVQLYRKFDRGLAALKVGRAPDYTVPSKAVLTALGLKLILRIGRTVEVNQLREAAAA